MCGRRSDFTTRPFLVAERPARAASRAPRRADSITDRPAPGPTEPPAGSPTRSGGPFDDTYGYRVTEEGLEALEEFERQHGKPVLRKVPLPDTVAEALADEAWRDRRRHYRREARARGNRLVTICGRHRNGRKVPELRIIGLWLEQAGFTYGRHCEVEITPGTLTIRAV